MIAMMNEEIDSDVNVEDDESFADNSSPSYLKEKAEKRAHHNLLERKRRCHIKDSFRELRDSIPALRGEVTKTKASRAQILKSASEYIVNLSETRNKNQKIIDELLEENLRLENEIKRLEVSSSNKLKNKVSSSGSSSINKKRKTNGPSSLSNKRTINLSSGLSSIMPIDSSSVRSSTMNDDHSWSNYDTRNYISSDLSSTRNDNGSSFMNVKMESNDSSVSMNNIFSAHSSSETPVNNSSDSVCNFNNYPVINSSWLDLEEDYNIVDINDTDLEIVATPDLSFEIANSSAFLNSPSFDEIFSSSSDSYRIDGNTSLNKLRVGSEDNLDSNHSEIMRTVDSFLEYIPIKEESIDITYDDFSDSENSDLYQLPYKRLRKS